MNERVDNDVDGERPENPRLLSLLRYWSAKRETGAPMAQRAAIDPGEIRSLLPIVLLVEVKDVPRIRLMGTGATDAYGKEMRGKAITEFDLGEFSASWRNAFDTVIREARPITRSGLLTRQDERWDADLLLLPLIFDGRQAGQLLGALDLRRQPFRKPAIKAGTPRQLTNPLGIDAGAALVTIRR